MNFLYKRQNTFQDRKAEFERIRERYPDRLPLICERSTNSKLPTLDKNKYLVPKDITAYHFNYIIRKRMNLDERQSLFFFAADRYIVKGDAFIAQIYDKHKDPDGYLYITYTEETTLGVDGTARTDRVGGVDGTARTDRVGGVDGTTHTDRVSK